MPVVGLVLAVLGACALQVQAYSCFYYQKLLPGVKYSITSPGWPLNYQANESCQWVAEAPQDQRVSLECDDLSMTTTQHMVESRMSADMLWASESGSHIQLDGMPILSTGNVVSHGNVLNMELRTSPWSTSTGRFHCFLSATQEHPWEVLRSVPEAAPQEPCACGWRLDGRGTAALGRLMGATEAKSNEFPMMAALAEGSTVFCGAVLVSSHHALTSAHCLREGIRPTVDLVVGDYDFSMGAEGPPQQKYKLSDFVTHPNWSGDWQRANIAIAKTKQEIALNFFVAPACVPSTKADFGIMRSGDSLLALGWGSDTYTGSTSNRVKYMHTFLMENKDCENKYQDKTLQEEHFCIGSYKDQAVCTGDPGGPLLFEDTRTRRLMVMGIISYGEGCTGAPIVNSKVSSYIDWIREVTGNTTCSPPPAARQQ